MCRGAPVRRGRSAARLPGDAQVASAQAPCALDRAERDAVARGRTEFGSNAPRITYTSRYTHLLRTRRTGWTLNPTATPPPGSTAASTAGSRRGIQETLA